MSTKLSFREFGTSFALCLALILVIGAQAVRDTSPWLEPFFKAARFDAQTGISANLVQAARGDHIDCLVWPGLPNAALGGAVLAAAGITMPEKVEGGSAKRPFYEALNRASQIGNLLGIPAVVLLVIATFFILAGIGGSRAIAFIAAAYLAVSQISSTNLGWVRTEAWSLVFLALALWLLAPWVRSWVLNAVPGKVVPAWRLVAAGFFLSSALLEKINVLPGVAVVALLAIVVAVQISQAADERRFQKSIRLWSLAAFLLVPWWGLRMPGATFWAGVSDFDAGSAQALGTFRWAIFVGFMILLSLAPLALVVSERLTSRILARIFTAPAAPLLSVARALAILIAGGYAALYFWCALISRSWESFQSHVMHVLVMVAAAVLGASPYSQVKLAWPDVWNYIWNSGLQLARPNFADLLLPLGWGFDRADWINITSLVLVCMVAGGVVCLLRRVRRIPVSHALVLAYAFSAAMLASEYLTSTRGALALDFRYYAYAGWFGILALAFFVLAWRPVTTSHMVLFSGWTISVLLSIVLVGFGLLHGMPTGSQNAVFGRQIYIGARTAPSLFKNAGIVAEPADWRALLDWTPVPVGSHLQEQIGSSPAGGGCFSVQPLDQMGVRLQALNPSPGWRLQVRVPVDLPQNLSPHSMLALSAYLQSSQSKRIPNIGLLIENKQTGEPVYQQWAIISSAWEPGPVPVEYAVAARIDPAIHRAFFLIDWAPREPGETMSVLQPAAGVMEIPATFLLSGKAQESSRRD
ncbi:MAG: hypothetical protein WCH98_00285 [Verrucomicrobiota bacterium]